MSRSTGEITRLLELSGRGDPDAAARLYQSLYSELRALAGAFMRNERPDHTLQPTALLHEAYLRLAAQTDADWKNRAQFFAVAGQAMRRVLVDYARSRGALRRGGFFCRKISLEDVFLYSDDSSSALLEIDEALDRLKALDERQSRIVEMRFFAALSAEEISRVLGVSSRTVEREWRVARAWLYDQLKQGSHDRPLGQN